jgi:hypothetical protein
MERLWTSRLGFKNAFKQSQRNKKRLKRQIKNEQQLEKTRPNG